MTGSGLPESFGRYQVVDRLGAGGMGEVYRVRDPELRRYVALKVPRADYAEQVEHRARFLREARAMAALKHPNVIAVHDVGTDGALPYMVMELLEGRTLRQVLRAGAPPFEQSLRWLREIAGALAHAHDAGLVHRDVKPENVFVVDDGTTRLLDFGLAKNQPPNGSPGDVLRTTADEHDFQTEGEALGTPRYMAPEQVIGATVDARADQYAWGRLAFELLGGVIPAGGGRDLRTVIDATPSVPAGLRAVLRRTQEPMSGSRFPSMHDVLVAIGADAAEPTDTSRPKERVLAGGTAPLHPPIAPSRASEGARSMPLVPQSSASAPAPSHPSPIASTRRSAEARPMAPPPVAPAAVVGGSSLPSPRRSPLVLVLVLVPVVLLALVVLVVGGIFVLAGRTQAAERELIASSAPAPCHAPARCVGRTKHHAARTTYPTCAPLVPQAIRAGDVVFVRNDEGFETTAVVVSNAGDRFEGRDWRNVVRSYPVSGVFGQYCKP